MRKTFAPINYTAKLVSPSHEKKQLIKAITQVLESKSNEQLRTLLSTLQGTKDSELKYPQIKRAQAKFAKIIEPERQN